MWASIKKFVFDQLSDTTGAWCGARVLVMSSGVTLIYKFSVGNTSMTEFCTGIAILAAAYAGKDWSERR
jgi:hypothetical protein